MAEIVILAEFFCLALALGLSTCSVLANTKMTGVGLYKVVMAICGFAVLGAAGLHLSYAHFNSPQVYGYVAAFVLMTATYFFHRDERSTLMWAIWGGMLLSLTYVLYHFQNAHLFLFLYALSSILYMGVVTYAMILGHWYLVTPRLSVAPLVKAHWLLWGLALIKLIILAYHLYMDNRFFVEGSTFGAGAMFNWVVLTMRVGWGYGVVLVMSFFSWRLVRMRSTQSATGVLYAMTFFILVGELTAMYMYFRYGMFL